MEYIGNTDLTYEKLEKIIINWANEGNLKKYLDNKYDKWLAYFGKSCIEVFVGDNEIDDYNEHALGYEDTFYIINEALISNGLNLDGEPLSWATDRMIELGFEVSKMNELIPYSEMIIELNSEGEFANIACDSEAKKEILDILEIKNTVKEV